MALIFVGAILGLIAIFKAEIKQGVCGWLDARSRGTEQFERETARIVKEKQATEDLRKKPTAEIYRRGIYYTQGTEGGIRTVRRFVDGKVVAERMGYLDSQHFHIGSPITDTEYLREHGDHEEFMAVLGRPMQYATAPQADGTAAETPSDDSEDDATLAAIDALYQ